MAICKMCHKPVPDGMDFCEECELKRTNQADESYLDSLLSSVSADLSNYSESVFENVSKHIVSKNSPAKAAKQSKAEESVTEASVTEASATEASVSEEPAIEKPVVEEPVVAEPVIEEPVIEEPVVEEPVVEEPVTDEPVTDMTVTDESIPDEPITDDSVSDDSVSDASLSDEPLVDDSNNEEIPIIDESIDALFEEIPLDDPAGPAGAEPEASSEEDVDELLDSLLADMDSVPAEDKPSEDAPELAPDDISDIFASVDPIDATGEEDKEKGLPGIEEIDFSADNIDSLKLDSIDSLDPIDPIGAMADPGILGEPELENTENSSEDPFDVTSVMNDIESGDFEKQISELVPEEKPKKDKKKKKSWFDKIFGNVIEERTPEQEKAYQEKLAAEAEKKKKQEEDKKQKKAMSKEEKEAQKAQQKAEKEEEAKRKAELKKQKAEEAKEKARKKKEEKLALEAAEPVNEGKINKIGATILFVIFSILTVIIIVGTNIYSYNLSIKNAQNEFNIKHYNDAYYEVYGLKIQDEDIDLYDKIMTVMYVNTQLNAYQYYMRSNNRDLALDSLLKGLQRYDKYLELATILDIENDLNYVKNNILVELNNEFGISEAEAKSMVSARDEVDYSEYIYTLLGTYEVDFGE